MKYKLGQVLEKYIRGPFGSALRRPEMKKSGIPVYEQQNAIYNHRLFRFYIDELKYFELKRFTVQPNDLIVSCSGTIGKVSIIKEKDPVGIISQALLILRPNNNIVLSEYLFYFLTSKYGYNSLVSRSSGSVQINIAKREVIENIEIDIPDLETQKKIVRILSALDQKIELNNQESENLHKIIKTLYGNATTSIKEKTKLADLAKISSGKRPMSIETNGEYAVVGARDVMGFTNEYNQEPEVIITGRVGTLGVVKRYQKKIWASDNTLIVDTRYKNYIECYLSSVDFSAYNRGSTQPLITQTDLKNFVLPFDKEKCDSFENKTASLRNKIFALEEQNEDLIMLRDTLLPKLMSGTIDLDKVMADE